jgi:hypothetical protein
MPSNIDGQCVIFMLPEGNIPFAMDPIKIPHITVLQIQNPDALFRRRLETMHIIDQMYEYRYTLSREKYEWQRIELLTSKVAIWWKKNGEKKVIVEV